MVSTRKGVLLTGFCGLSMLIISPVGLHFPGYRAAVEMNPGRVAVGAGGENCLEEHSASCYAEDSLQRGSAHGYCKPYSYADDRWEREGTPFLPS